MSPAPRGAKAATDASATTIATSFFDAKTVPPYASTALDELGTAARRPVMPGWIVQ